MCSSLAVTGAAMDAPVSSSLGVMGPLLRKLDSLLPPYYRLPKPLKDRIELLKADLEEISVALVEQSMVDSSNEMAKYWMNEVRDLCYDIEDFIDNMMSKHADGKMRSVQSFKVGRVKIPWLPKTVKPCTRAAKITELTALVREAIERHERYLDGCTSSSRCLLTVHGQIPSRSAEAANYLVGIDDAKTKLIKWLTDEKEQQLKMVAITGHSGVGKTTLAKRLYREVEEQFDCRAFVRASRKPDMRRLLGGILSQVQQHGCHSNSCTVQNLIDNLTKLLQNKRYVIVIDDLWETTAWDIVASAFPEGNNRSRIITTTEIEGIALECCDYQSDNILKMKPLAGEDSGKLLLNLVFGPERLCPEQLKGASDIIITRCAGLPLATICVSGLLTTQPDNPELWQHVQEFLCSNLSTDSTLEETLQEILKLSYNSLPHYLKTCLMYLSVYPEGYTMWKFDLVKQWIAEGFICATEGTDIGEVADSYFEELVNRGMIQPVDINYNGEVLSCTLHHVVLDLITLESTEERFITALDYSQTIREHYSKARRLSFHFSNPRYATKPTDLTLSKVRSLGFFGILECVPTIVGFKHLRVLTLEFWGDQRGSTSFNLTGICRLFQLKYLKISCDDSVEVELPTQMRMLRYLETLITDAAVSAVPLDIVHLPGLLHLSLGDKTALPDEIGRIRSLRTLHCFDLGSNSEDNVLSLGNLTNLQDLHLTYCRGESDEHLKRNLAALAFSLGKLVNLQSVTLAPGASGTAIYHDVWSNMSSLPVFLQRLELLPPICIFSRLPEWIGQLRKLCILNVVVSELLMEDMDILTGLLALTIFSLYVRQPTAESIIFKKGAFLGLKCFKYTCGVLSLAFQEEAFPNLQRLELSFNAHRGEQYHDLLSGIDYLLNLKEIAGTIGAATGAEETDRRIAESALRDAIRKHPRFPSYDNVKRANWVHEEYQLRTQADSSNEKHETLQKQHGRKEGDSLHEQPRILLKETEEDTKQCADSWISNYPATESIILSDQMKSVSTPTTAAAPLDRLASLDTPERGAQHPPPMGTPQRPRAWQLVRTNAMRNSSYSADTGADGDIQLSVDRAARGAGGGYTSQTSFRIRGGRGGAEEVAELFRQLGLSGPEDLAIPPAIYAAAMTHLPKAFGRRASLEESSPAASPLEVPEISTIIGGLEGHLVSPSPNRRFRRTITSWIKGRHIGSGSFGSVYEAISDDGFFFAVKKVLIDQGINAKQRIVQLEHEVSLLSRLEHDNIVQYYGTDKKDGKLYIFLELVTQGSLAALYQKYCLQDSQVSAYTRQILNGLNYLHQRNVLHRDIKCANILVDANGLVKLADFGLAKEMSILSQARSSKGTVFWMAPEVAKAKPHGPPADIWSLGCTVLEMLTGKIPYPDMEWTRALLKIGRGIPPKIPNTLSEDAKDFITRCVQSNPKDRPSAAELLEHPFVHRPLQH